MEKITTFNNENLLQPKSELTLKLKSNKILKNISLLAMLFFLGFNSAISQSVDNPTKNKAIAVPDNGVFIKKSNKVVSRATTITKWVSYDQAYDSYYGTSSSLTRMSNGPLSNGTDVHMNPTSGVDTVFTFGAYSVIDLRGAYYQAIFTTDGTPFDVTDNLTLDSVALGFVYEKFDNSVVDTAVVRIAVPSSTSTPQQMQSVFNYRAPNDMASSQACSWLGVFFNSVDKEIANKVAEVKIPLTTAWIKNPSNWRGTDSTSFYVEVPAGQNITGHDGYLAVEVNVIHGRQLTSADTIGVNANWFSPLYLTAVSGGKPQYLQADRNCGGVLYTGSYMGTNTNTIFNSHWFGNSDNQAGDDPFQSAWVSLKITQNNDLNVGLDELNNNAKLFQNYPNPTNNMTTVKYELMNGANVSFEMIDVTGKKVMSITEGNKNAGTHTIEINTNELNAGIYFYSILVDGNVITKKMTITK